MTSAKLCTRALAVGFIMASSSACDVVFANAYECARDRYYSSNWDEYEFSLQAEEPSTCPPDLDPYDIVAGGAEVLDEGSRDGEAGSVLIENSLGQEMASVVKDFVEYTSGEWILSVYSEYEVATGPECFDTFEFDVQTQSGLEWAETTVRYHGDVFTCP